MKFEGTSGDWGRTREVNSFEEAKKCVIDSMNSLVVDNMQQMSYQIVKKGNTCWHVNTVYTPTH